MAYKKVNFKDRLIETPMTFNMITNDDGTITLIPSTGEIYQVGTDINANNMDHVEEGIVELENSLNENIELLKTKDTELNTKITDLTNNVYVKGNFAVLEGTSSDTLLQLNYPSGFTNENCILIGYGFAEDDYYTILTNFPTSVRILLSSNLIAIVTPNPVQKVRILLFKYK